MKFDYVGLKELSKELERPVSTLYALSHSTDPFFVGPARQAVAQWFAEEWHRLKMPTGWHYRRIHYVFVSQDGTVKMLEGKPYENTMACWSILCEAARDAIALELMPQNAFVDHRNATPIIYLVEPQPSSTEIIDAKPECWVRASSLPELTFSRPVVPQRFHLEIWAEKTTVNDVLDPLARQHNFNLVTGIGENSATRCRELVDRAQRSRRPVRILYISDFDPGGLSMPVAVARKIEHEIYKRRIDLDVQLRPIILTAQQCIDYRLPRTPLKETERRAVRFQERFGEGGGTELDALEALHPGLLRRIVLTEVKRYWNPRHNRAVEERCEQIEDELGEITVAAHDAYNDEIAELNADWQKILAAVKAWEERAKPTWQAIANSLEQKCLPVGEVVCPEFDADEDPDPLYDSRRSYLEQIDRYKRHQGKRIERKAGSGCYARMTHP
jgi:hypothetical protein